MYESRENELKKLMVIMNKLTKEVNILNKDIDNIYENKSKELVSYIEEKIKQNINSIKELENPFLLFIMGSGNYGKSTLINALLQDKIIETSDIPNTWKLDMFVKSDKEKIKITYNNEEAIIKNLISGRKLLLEEENKFKISKQEISKKILKYKNKLSKEKLKEFKIEQEKLYLYKSNIYQIKYYLKDREILNDFIIVDTPGLNQTLLKNTLNRMNEYYQKSDGVIWMIDAQNIVSKQTNKLIEEINNIDNLHEKKIIGVVNKIDLIKNNNDLDRIKEKINNIYKDKFNDIVYISSRQALDGYIYKDKELVDKSNIHTLYKSIDKNFKEICEKNQIKSKYKNLSIMKNQILSKIYSYKRCLYNDISLYNEISNELDIICDDIYLYTLNYIKKLKNKNLYTKEDINILINRIKELEIKCNNEIKKNYDTLFKKANFNNTIINSINTNIDFYKSKYLLINHNSFKTERKNNKLPKILNKIQQSNYQNNINNHICINLTYLEDEILNTLKDKLEDLKININEVKCTTFKNKYLDYDLIKNHIYCLDNIENILINLR